MNDLILETIAFVAKQQDQSIHNRVEVIKSLLVITRKSKENTPNE